MAKTSLNDIRSLSDPLMSYNWDFVIPNMPGGGDSRSLTFKAQSTSIPGVQLEPVIVGLHGIEVTYAGRQMFSHTLDVTFLETRDIGTRTAIRNWMELARNQEANSGDYKANYSTEVQMILYDDTGAEVRKIRMFGVYPSSLQDVAVDGSQGAIVQVAITFSYDNHIDENV